MARIAFDIDDTIFKIDRKYGKQIPDYKLISLLEWFYNNGDEVFLWSAGGVDYAKQIAEKLGLIDMVKIIPKEKNNYMDLTFDDEDVNLGMVNIKVKRENQKETILFVDGWCSKSNQKNVKDRIMIWVVTDDTGKVLEEKRKKGGSNNIAEFLAIREALKYCVVNNIKNVVICSDSSCAISWYYKEFDEEKFLNKKINNAQEVLNIKKDIDCLLLEMENIIVKQIPREENLAGHYIENKYSL